jgi:hypothetical protein
MLIRDLPTCRTQRQMLSCSEVFGADASRYQSPDAGLRLPLASQLQKAVSTLPSGISVDQHYKDGCLIYRPLQPLG